MAAGRPRVYTHLSIWLTSLVAAAGQWSDADLTAALADDQRLAEAWGYPTAPRRTLSPAQYRHMWRRRVRALGLLPYFLFFVALVWTLLRLGVISGWDLIVDRSYLDAGYHADPDAAWGRPLARQARRFGYKIHSVICRWSYLPLLLVITPLTIPWLAATVRL